MEHNTLAIASANAEKAVELAELLEGLPWTVRSLADFPAIPPPEETGETFAENARQKALYYCERLGVPCAADDSGLVVDALGGAPGVYSARYAGPDCSYDDNNRKLLTALDGAPEALRTGRFVCVAALALPGVAQVHLEEGSVEGRIAMACRGTNGFGYDPLFIPDGHNRTFAEMTAAEKHRLSHRGRAFAKLRAHLTSLAC